jgi:hypothetical protein
MTAGERPQLDPSNGSPRLPAWVDLAGWCWLLLTAVFLMTFLIPRKGVEFSDEGWVLSASLAAARGWHLDTVVPQAPMWALNALLMAAGAESYVAMRWLFYALISLCLAIAIAAVEPDRRFSGLKAGLVTFAGLTTLSSLVSYNTTPHYLILGGVGLFLLADDTPQRGVRVGVAALSGLAFSAGGFLNFTVWPAALITIVLVWALRGRPRLIWACLATMAIVSGLAVAWYLRRVGLQTFFHYPGGHGIDKRRVVTGFFVVLEWVAPAMLLRGCATMLTRHQPPEQRRRASHTAAAAFVLGFGLLLLACLLNRLNLWSFATRLDPVLRAAGSVGLTGLAQLNGNLPAHVIAVWGVAVLVSVLVLCREPSETYRRVVLCACCLYVCYLWQEFFSLMDPRLMPIYYAGPCFGLGFWLLLRRPAALAARVMSASALAVAVAGALAFSVFYNHPNLNPVLGHKVGLTIPKLAGLRESPARADTLQSLVQAFDSYGCRGRTLLTFQATRFLYYLFEVEPPRGLEYLYVPYIFDSSRVMQTLEQSGSWCVFVSWNWLDWPTPQAKAGTEVVMDYLQQHSERIVRLSPRAEPVHPYDDFVLYAGPAMSDRFRHPAPLGK